MLTTQNPKRTLANNCHTFLGPFAPFETLRASQMEITRWRPTAARRRPYLGDLVNICIIKPKEVQLMAATEVYPYIPNSVPEVKAAMLKKIGISSVEEIFAEIPERLRFKGELKVPGPIASEYDLRRHVEELLARNKDCKEYIGFLGGGIYNHFVPSVVTTIMARDEFLTSYVGEAY